MGWTRSWCTDSNLSSKKFYTGYQFSSKSKKWLPRIVVNDASMKYCVRRLNWLAENSPSYCWQKPDMVRVEQLSERAAALYHLGLELQDHVPIKTKALDDAWYEAWANGSEHVDTELQALQMEKSDAFDVTKHVLAFKKLINEHIMAAPIPMDVTTADKLEVDNKK